MKSIVLLLLFMATLLIITSYHYIKMEDYSTVDLSNVKTFGMGTLGGQAGKIIYVTNLQSDGVGSLKWAIEQNGKRQIKFKVAGLIDLSNTIIRIKNPHASILGATAPSPGITIVRGGIIINTHDIKISHIRVRPGDKRDDSNLNWEPDGITIAYGNAKNIHIDHVSTSWAVDENIAASGTRLEGFDGAASDITISNSLIAEGLSDSIHSRGKHSKGVLIHDFVQNVAIIGNFFASNAKRNPYFKGNTSGVVVNNLMYNVETAAIQLNYVESEYEETSYLPKKPKVSIVGNVLVYGNDTIDEISLVNGRGDAFIYDNLILKDKENMSNKYYELTIDVKKNIEIWPEGLIAKKANQIESIILKNVGARPWDRDETDKRIIASYLNNTGKIINSQEDVGGYTVE